MSEGADIGISPLSIERYDSVLALWRLCEGIGLNDADSRGNIGRYLERNPGMSFVALDHATVVGTVLAGHDGRRGLLHHLAVHPDYRHRGIGRILVKKALDALHEQGIAKCHGFVFRNNQSGLDFWASAGWSVREDIYVISADT